MRRRSLGGAQAEFARQLTERNNVTRPQKKFKTAAPKGAKLGAGYIDRTRERIDDDADERTQRIKALEDSLKKEEIDQATFDKLRSEIAGGDLESTHLVKGLDFKLLQRIREGEDIYGEKRSEPEQEAGPEENVDDEFDQLEKQEVEAIAKEKAAKKKGQLSTVSLAPGKKRTRDQILAELKASRMVAKQLQESALGDRFRKISVKQKPGTRIERDSKGREVLIIVDEDGHEKKKVRKLQRGETEAEMAKNEILMPNKNAKPLGMEVPEQYRQKEEPDKEEDEDVDIFDGVGDDYDPLAGMDGSDSDSEEDNSKAKSDKKPSEEGVVFDAATQDGAMLPPPKPTAAAPRNYFKDAKTGLISDEAIKAPSMSDPAIQAAIKRAAALNRPAQDEDDEDEDGEASVEKKVREEKRRRMLSNNDRDDADLDMGFGTSRFEDEEDFEDSQIKLSTWGKDYEEGESKGGASKRKRGPKKRKGDANNADDVLRVMEQRKKQS